jgi:phenylacetate-coenzyme A ligase PaaK-like adenylate-forming protein
MMQWKEVLQYQVYQPDRENLEARVVCKDTVDAAYLERIRSELQGLFGESMRISIRPVDEIELTSGGKRRHVISEVTPDFL